MADLLTHCFAVAVVCFGADSCTPMQIRVWDGDSMRIGLDSSAEAIRLKGIDTPEMGGKCLAESMLAELAKRAMCNSINGQTVVIERKGDCMFGRTCVNLCVKNGDDCWDIGKQMIDQGYAVPWGGRRESWCDGQPRSQKRAS